MNFRESTFQRDFAFLIIQPVGELLHLGPKSGVILLGAGKRGENERNQTEEYQGSFHGLPVVE